MRRFILCLLCACMLLFCACGGSGDVPGALPLSTAQPPAPDVQGAQGVALLELYYLTADGRRLSSETRSVAVQPGVSHAAAAVAALQESPASQALRSVIQEGVQFDTLALSADACNVFFTGDAELDTGMWLITRAAVAATVFAVEGVGSANLFYNGKEPGYNGRPLGTQTPVSEALDVYLKNLEAEYAPSSAQSEAGSYETRTATLYFADVSDTLLLARNISLSYDGAASLSQIAEQLLSRLREGDAGANALEPVLPADLTLAEAPGLLPLGVPNPVSAAGAAPHAVAPEEAESAEGAGNAERLLTLLFATPHYEYNETLMCGALTLTMTGYLPNIAGVRIMMQDAAGNIHTLGAQSYFTREMFADNIGYNITLAYPDAEGAAFRRVSRSVAAQSAYDPQVRLAALLAGPADPGVPYPLFAAEDVRRVYIVGDTAIVDWKAGFMRKLEMLSAEAVESTLPAARRAWLFIYGVVDTLTEMPGVNRVWMTEDGNKLEMIGNVYLGNALMRNPGMLLDE